MEHVPIQYPASKYIHFPSKKNDLPLACGDETPGLMIKLVPSGSFRGVVLT